MCCVLVGEVLVVVCVLCTCRGSTCSDVCVCCVLVGAVLVVMCVCVVYL